MNRTGMRSWLLGNSLLGVVVGCEQLVDMRDLLTCGDIVTNRPLTLHRFSLYTVE